MTGESWVASGLNVFFMVFLAMGWPVLDHWAFGLIVNEQFYGELVGVAAAMLGLWFLQYWQNRREAVS